MALILNDNAPGAAPGGYVWTDPNVPVEVDDPKLCEDLLKIAGFHEVQPDRVKEYVVENPQPAKPAKPVAKTPLSE